MITYFVAFLSALMTSTVLTLVVRNRSLAWGLVDEAASSRKIHTRPIPRLGGIAIVGGFFTPLAALFIVDTGVGRTFLGQPGVVWGLMGGGLTIAALGLYDDLCGAGARPKFLIQFLVALALYAAGLRIELISMPFGQIPLGYLSLPFTVLWIVGVVNAINLIDGLDGLAGGVAFFAVGTNFVLALARGDVLMCLLMAALAGAVLGFLFFNFNPATIFMGDTGSMFLGFVLAAASIKTSSKSGTTVAMLVPVLALGLPIMDTLLAMARRFALGRPMFSADKEHIHHRLMSRLRLTHRRAVVVLYAVCCLFALTALGLSFANSAQSALLLCGVSVVVFVFMRKLGYLNLADAGVVTVTRRRNRELRITVTNLGESLGRANSPQDIWEAVRRLAEAVDASRLELRLSIVSVSGTKDAMVFETERPSRGLNSIAVRAEIGGKAGALGNLSVEWRDGRSEVNRDEELAVELIADFISRALAALPAPNAREAKVVSLRR